MLYKSINGQTLKEMVEGSFKNLSLNQEYINSLNVFPVPDGDTGTNMTMTLSSAVKELNAIDDVNTEAVAIALQKGSLKGARGNSGVILSQILKGMCEIFKELDEISTKDFSNALKRGTEMAYNAVTKPKEGTILTVIRVIAESSQRASRTSDFIVFMQRILEKGEEILAQTTEMLPALKKAGVVDAGGKGVLEILRGMYNVLADIPMAAPAEEKIASSQSDYNITPNNVIAEMGNIEFGYCTEFFVININKDVTLSDIDKLRDKLMKIGDCVICIGDLSMVKVHVHTNTPGVALQYGIELGEIDKIKIENMREENREIQRASQATRKSMSMISICNGDGIKDLFSALGVEHIIDGGQTMNPSVDNILSCIKKANSDNVIIFPNNKNIILAAEQAASLAECNVLIVPTVNVVQGLRAAMCYDFSVSPDDNFNNMKDCYADVVFGEITHSVKNTNVDDLDIKEGDLLGIDGSHIVVNSTDINTVMDTLLDKLGAATKDTISLFYGSDVSQEDADKMAERIGSNYSDADVTAQYGGQQHYYYLISME